MPNPTAVGPLLTRHRQANAELTTLDQWTVAARYPDVLGENRLIDCSHWTVAEVQSEKLAASLSAVCGLLPGIGRFKKVGDWVTYQLTPNRAIVTGLNGGPDVVDVTGGWAAVVLCGPDSLSILSHVTGLDVRAERFPAGACKQGPVFGVNTLVANRGENRFELHVCPDSLEFLWDALLDAGAAYGLRAAGLDQDE